MEHEEEKRPASAQTRRETAAALLFLPVHLVLLPSLAASALAALGLAEEHINFACYAVGALYMLATQWGFLRRDFDALRGRVGYCIPELLSCCVALMLLNTGVNTLMALVLGMEENPNNEAIFELAAGARNSIFASAIYLAPIVEELIFRAGIFGSLRKYGRVSAYAFSALAFALYHVWPYLSGGAENLLYIVQYIPAACVLCRLYERTESIWMPIFLHMMLNGVSLSALEAIGAL